MFVDHLGDGVLQQHHIGVEAFDDALELEEGLDSLFSYIETGGHVDLIKAAVAHVEFEALHPFKDGNGRIGRMLITLMLWKAKLISQPHYYISGYFEEHKDQYIDSMRRVSEENDNEGLFIIVVFQSL